MEKFRTDGVIIINEKGECMGIYSAVNLLNIRAERFHELEEELEGAINDIAWLMAELSHCYTDTRLEGDFEDELNILKRMLEKYRSR